MKVGIILFDTFIFIKTIEGKIVLNNGVLIDIFTNCLGWNLNYSTWGYNVKLSPLR
jgi:hypothetical protein